MAKKWLILLLIISILLSILICFVPVPRQIKTPMTAYEIDQDGSVLAEEEILFRATRYRYLLHDDVPEAEDLRIDTMEFSKLSFSSLIFKLKGDLSTYREDYDHAFYSVFITDGTGFEYADIYIDKEEQWLLFYIGNGSRNLVCTADPAITPAEILGICRDDLK